MKKKMIMSCCILLLFVGGSILVSTSSASEDIDKSDSSQVHILGPELELRIDQTYGWFVVFFTVKNIGDTVVHNVRLYSVHFEGQVLYNNRTSGIETEMDPGEYTYAATDLQFGMGRFVVTITITCDEGVTDTRSANGFAIGPLCIIP